MAQKLLVISSGTTAADVAQEFNRQWLERKRNKLSKMDVIVRCIDTADLSTRGFLRGEWFPLSIDNQFMDGINEKPEEHYPELAGFLYNRPPETTSDGGGGIRYNGAGALILNRTELREWIQESMVALGKMGDRNADFATAIVISSVGATGSGTVERLVESVIGAARAINPDKDPHVDVFILQPGREKVTELGLANTVALFAEMAASRLAGTNTSIRRHKGRTILVGWGTNPRLISIEQLEESAASLIRIINDPITNIESEYRQRAVDNTMLHAIDPYTHLPTHLSSATAITIGLGNLEEQIVQLDMARLLTGMVFNASVARTEEEQVSTLHDAISSFLVGDDPEARYNHLLDSISEDVALDTPSLSPQTFKGVHKNQRGSKLNADWQADIDILKGPGRKIMERKGDELIEKAIKEMANGRRNGLATGQKLEKIRDDYDALHSLLTLVRRHAQNYAPTSASDDKEVNERIAALGNGGLFQGGALRNAIGAVQENVHVRRQREAHAVASRVLKEIDEHCTRMLNNLEVIIKETQQSYGRRAIDPTNDELPLRIEADDMLHMAALSNTEEIRRYYLQVSLFSVPSQEELDEEGQADAAFDPLADFRQKKAKELDTFFKGDFQAVLRVVRDYTSTYIREKIKDNSVIDILLAAGEDILYRRIEEAADKANSLVSFTPRLASKSRQVRHVCAACRNSEQQSKLNNAMQKAFRQGECTYLKSEDPTEIIVFYYIDGLPMSAVRDLSGRCLDKFLEHQRNWHLGVKASGNGHNANSRNSLSTVIASMPVYSGKDAEELINRTGVIKKLYDFRDQAVITRSYSPEDVPELGLHPLTEKENEDEIKTSHQENTTSGSDGQARQTRTSQSNGNSMHGNLVSDNPTNGNPMSDNPANGNPDNKTNTADNTMETS